MQGEGVAIATRVRCTLSSQMRNHAPLVWPVAVFKQINPLPSAQGKSPICDRDTEVCGQKGRFDMRGHIVRAFIGMGQIGHRRVCRGRDQARKEVLQIHLHLGVCVFLNNKTGRGVLDKECQQAGPLDPTCHLTRKLVKTGTIGGDRELRLHAASIG